MRKMKSKTGVSRVLSLTLALLLTGSSLSVISCTSKNSGEQSETENTEADGSSSFEDAERKFVEKIVDFERELDDYAPMNKKYNFYFTYKTVHPWWDAVALGMEAAQKDFLDKGIVVTYEYMAPDTASAEVQKKMLQNLEKGKYDVIGVDVADEDIISPVMDDMIDNGYKVMTFSSSDSAENCKRIAYVGNTHNYEDGVELTEALCKKLGYEGKVAILVGTKGAPCHEERAQGAKDTIAKYDKMEIAACEYDMDSAELAYTLTKQILEDNPELDGIVCCNMSNPVGAARAVKELNSKAVIVGMDHDKVALEFLNEGTIYCLGVQDCYSIGYDTIQVAVKIADGNLPGDLFSEKTDEITTLIYQEDAVFMHELLYGDLS